MAQEMDKVMEIASLNLDALDVEELERRLEMASAEVSSAAWICGTNDNHPPPSCTCNVVTPPVDTCPNLA